MNKLPTNYHAIQSPRIRSYCNSSNPGNPNTKIPAVALKGVLDHSNNKGTRPKAAQRTKPTSHLVTLLSPLLHTYLHNRIEAQRNVLSG